MATLNKVITTSVMILALLSKASGQSNYWVSNSGSDSNPGTEAQPWLTIQKAANSMGPGSTAFVLSGLYDELVTTRTNGTSGSPITFQGIDTPVVGSFRITNHWQVVRGFSLRGTNSVDGPALTFSLSSANCLVQSNVFELTGVNVGQLGMVHGEWGRVPSNHVIMHNRFLHPNYICMSVQGQGHTVASNYFTQTNGWDAIILNACNTVISSNRFDNWSRPDGSDQHTDLLQSFSSNGEVSTNNVFERNYASDCSGTQIGNFEDQAQNNSVANWTFRNNVYDRVEAAANIYCSGFKFHNNVFYKSGLNTGGAIVFKSSVTKGQATNGVCFNNIFVECSSGISNTQFGWYSTAVEITDLVADNNLVIGAGAGTTKVGFTDPNGLNGVDPLFVDPENGDFRLQSSSQCIGAGTNLNASFTIDISGTTRGDEWDIGAFEYAPSGGGGGGGGSSSVRAKSMRIGRIVRVQ